MYQDEIKPLLPERIQKVIEETGVGEEHLQEIRIRREQPISLQCGGRTLVPKQRGQVVSGREFKELLSRVSQYSLYAFEEEIKKGYLTIPGGHRIGLMGKTVLENGEVKTVRHISFLNIRISHEIIGCADPLIPHIFENGRLLSTMLVSPPGGGKTTLLRDLVRQIASDHDNICGRNTAVIDERSEIAGSYMGIPQNRMGTHCDVVDGCPKSIGIQMVVRSMSPEVIAVDEVGTKKDCEAIRYALASGCAVLATMHGDSMEQLREKDCSHDMIAEGMFDRYVMLKDRRTPGMWKKIYDGKGRVIAE